MFRNKEFKNLILISIIVVMIESILIFSEKKELSLLSITVLITYMTYVIYFTIIRYKKIESLSQWLFALQGVDGDDISGYVDNLKKSANHDGYKFADYEEGELSILKSEVYKVTIQMIELNERLLNEKTYLADTLADISHQLKTPMTSMLVMADLLNDENLPSDKREEFTKNIGKQLERMEWLLSTLLKMSKLDAGTLKLNPRPTSLKGIIEKSVSHLIIPMELKGQSFNMCRETKGENDILINADENWIAEAISNIVKNCVEHTNYGGNITIKYGENPLFTYITIQDNGKGIEPKDLPHIFERFYKGKNADKDSVGIGLAFAKQIINLLNGSIEVTSKENEGSIFFIKFYKSSV